MYAQVSALWLYKDIRVNFLVEASTLLVTTAWLEVSTELRAFGMLDQDNALRRSAVIMMKSSTPASTRQETSVQLQVQMDSHVSITYLLVLVPRFYKATRMKLVRYSSTPKATKS